MRVCVIGVGLIGGSLGKALRRKAHVVGLGRRASDLAKAKRSGALHSASTDPKTALEKADLAVFCVPVPQISELIVRYAPYFKKGAVITDAGSVKGPIIAAMKALRKKRPDLSFAGAHPIAGSEKSGVANAEAGLFRGSTCVVVKDGASFKALNTVRRMWTAAGARCILMTAAEHDRALALTSHLPHLLAFALFSQADKSALQNPILKSLIGGSFRDMTRIVGSNPAVWSGIFRANRKELTRVSVGFINQFKRILNAPPSNLEPAFTKLATAKKRWPSA